MLWALGPVGGGIDSPVEQVSAIPFGGTTGKMTPPTCTIKRRANSLDEHSLERAQRMAGKRNLDTMEIFPFSVYLKIAFQPIHPT